MKTEQAKKGQNSTSFGTLMSDLARDVSTLVSDEAQLAKAEMSEKTGQLATGIGAIATAGAVLMSGFLVLLAAAVFGLNNLLPPQLTPWLSALIVGGIVVVIGFIMLAAGRAKLKAKNLMPEHTIASFQKDSNMVRKHDGHPQEKSE
jgi:uncharacterized membrane protein YgdD (TMEM256/DUF423 family)